MPLLAFCLVAGMAWWTWPGLLLLGALCCSWVGDVLMMCGVFVGGLGAFLVAHVCYVIAFLGHARGAGRRRAGCFCPMPRPGPLRRRGVHLVLRSRRQRRANAR